MTVFWTSKDNKVERRYGLNFIVRLRLNCNCYEDRKIKEISIIYIYLLESIYLYFPPSSQLLQLLTAGTTVENKGKLILTEIFPSVQKHDI